MAARNNGRKKKKISAQAKKKASKKSAKKAKISGGSVAPKKAKKGARDLLGKGHALDLAALLGLLAAPEAKATNCTNCCISDRRLKEDIRPLSGALDRVSQLQGVRYSWKDKETLGTRPQIGLLAQDLEKVYPELVFTDPDSGLKAVDYAHLVAPLIEAIKALNEKLERQENEIASLKAKVAN